MKLRLLAMTMIVLGSASLAQAEGWLPIWNPFATTTRTATPAPVVQAAPQPTIWQRVTAPGQQAWNGTVGLLNPWGSSAPAKPTSPSGTRRVIPSKPAPQDQTSWLPWNWFTDDEPQPRYDNPSDWLSQPRP